MLGSSSSCLFKGRQKQHPLLGEERERMQMGEACPGSLSCSPPCLWESPHRGSSLSFSALRGCGH